MKRGNRNQLSGPTIEKKDLEKAIEHLTEGRYPHSFWPSMASGVDFYATMLHEIS